MQPFVVRLATSGSVTYAFFDLELSDGLPEVRIDATEDGAAFLIRLQGRPVHWSLHPLVPGTTLHPDELWDLIGRDVGPVVLAARIRDELVPPPPREAVSVSVAICTHDRTELLADLLQSLRLVRADRPDLDVLVVDNAPSDDRTRDLVLATEGVRYVSEPRPGLDIARNRALRESDREFVAYLDDDVIVDRGWLHGLEEAVSENPDVGLLTGLVVARRLDTEAQVLFERRGGFGRGVRKLRYHGTELPGAPLFPVGAGIFGAGANMTVRRSLMLELGGFDEALDTGRPLPGGGDLDAFYRVIRAGWPLCYEPAMLVFHLHRQGLDELRRQYRTWGQGLVAFLEKTSISDPEQRVKVRGMGAWWSGYAVRNVLRSMRSGHREEVDMAIAELTGGVLGVGGYRRSRRRVRS